MNVAILGASDNPERYSWKAQKMLMEAGHQVFPVSPSAKEVLGVSGYSKLEEIPEKVDTLTLYVSPANLAPVSGEILSLAPRRVIFNPGTEEDSIREQMEEAGIHTLEACTLVLLSTGEFETA